MNDENQTRSTDLLDGVGSQALTVVDNLAPKGWRMRLAKATSQLLVGTRAGAAVYAQAREHIDEIEGRSAMNKALFATATQQVLNDPEMVERAKARLVGGMLAKQENLEAVIGGAMERVLALPAPITDTSGSENGSEEPAPSDPPLDQPLNADWAAAFTEAAENATTDELRERLSRVLAGEISSKGSFPRSTIRAIADLERTDLEAFVEVLPFTYGKAVFQEPVIEKRVLELLGECGILDYNPSMGLTTTWNVTSAEPAAFVGSKWAIIMEVTEPKVYNFPVAPLTRVGRAVLSLLDEFNEEVSLKSLAERIDKTGVIKIVLGKYEQMAGDRVTLPAFHTIFPKTSFSTIVGPTNRANPFSIG